MGNTSDRRHWGRAVRYCAWFAVALVATVLAAALILPEFLDTPAVRAEIQRRLSVAVNGEVTWDELSVRILPAPHGALRKLRVEVAGTASISAERADVRLRLWPLVRGRAEVVSVTLLRPAIILDVPAAREAHDAGKEKDDDPRLDLVQTYRSTVGALADIVQRFAPDTVLSIEDAQLEFSAPGILPIALHDVAVRARTGDTGMDVDASMAGTRWSRIKVAARLQFADLSGSADIQVTGLKPQSWLDHYLAESPLRISIPVGDVRVRARTDGKTKLESEFEARAGPVGVQRAGERLEVPEVGVKGKVTAAAQEIAIHLSDARLGPSRLRDGVLRYSPKDGSLAGEVGYDLDLAQGMDSARRLVPAASDVLSWFEPVTGRAQGRVKLAFGRPDWSVVVDIAKSDAALQVRDLPGPLRLAHGNVEIDRHGVKVTHAEASIPAGQLRLSTLRHTYKERATAASAEFDIDLAQTIELVRGALPDKNRDALAVIQSASGRARGTTKLALGRKGWSADAEILKSDARVQVRGLPGPAAVSSGSVRVVPGSVKVERAAVTLLDARANASATISYGDRLRVEGSIADGTVGEKLLEWVWQTAGVPPHLVLKTPIGVTAEQFAWGPDGVLSVRATARFAAGPNIAIDLGRTVGALDIRRAVVKDERSDALIVARIAGSRMEGRFSGSLHASSIAAMLKGVTTHGGGISGDLRIAFDRDRPREASAEGNLKGESLDLAALTGQPLKIERIDLAADGASLRIREAVANWAEQRVTIRGGVKRGAAGPVVDAQVDSPGIDVDALLQSKEKEEKGAAVKPAPEDPDSPSRLWPLPVTGRVLIRSDFVQSGRYKVAPISASLVLEEQRAHLDLKEARLCGISFPLAIEATPGGVTASAKITAQKQQLEHAAQCLAGQHVVINGDFDLTAAITAQGKAGELVRNMKGSVVADMRDGKVMKFGMLGNILSMQNVAALLKQGGPKLDAQGFPYRRIRIVGKFDAGRFVVEEGAFHSDAIGLATSGWISLLEPESRLLVLVAPFSRVDELVRRVPVAGYVVGGTFTSVPVGVSGDIRDPLIVPLGPGAITSEVLGIFERTLKLPVKLVEPLREKK